jgi:hypothetical protein
MIIITALGTRNQNLLEIRMNFVLVHPTVLIKYNKNNVSSYCPEHLNGEVELVSPLNLTGCISVTCRFLFGKYMVRVYASLLAILIEVSCSFPQSF